MDRGPVAVCMEVAKDNGDIAKADDPFGIFGQEREIQLIDNMHGTIAAAGAKDGLYPGIVEHLLEIGRPFGVGAAEDGVFFSDGVAYLEVKAPAFDELGSGEDLFFGDITGGAGDADGVAG